MVWLEGDGDGKKSWFKRGTGREGNQEGQDGRVVEAGAQRNRDWASSWVVLLLLFAGLRLPRRVAGRCAGRGWESSNNLF